MRTAWREVSVDAIDYEMIRLSEGSAVTELGGFGDVFSSARPPWRLVAGYLMLAAAPGSVRRSQEAGLDVYSHGQMVARVELTASAASWSLVHRSHSPVVWREHRGILRGPGIALVPEGGTSWSLENETVLIQRATPWAVTIVHGPADHKVDTRVRLLSSLQAVGGRRG
ncbi:hypothetical protein [Microbacterium sp. P5_E9]